MHFAVSGHTGFIGQHLVGFLHHSAHKVTLINKDIVDGSLELENIDHVFHLAAKTNIKESWEQIEKFSLVNVQGMLKILEQARIHKCSVTYLSTYMSSNESAEELRQLTHRNPYTLTKSMGEELCRFYNKHHQVPISILRLANIYGPRQKESFLIPHIVKQLVSDNFQEITVETLLPKRDYLYVDDTVQALMQTIPESKELNILNVGTGICTSVEDIIKTCLKIAGSQKPYRSRNQERVSEIYNPIMDCSKITEKCSWKPRVSLDQGLKAVINSYRENL